jgi:hypothetical protein
MRLDEPSAFEDTAPRVNGTIRALEYKKKKPAKRYAPPAK